MKVTDKKPELRDISTISPYPLNVKRHDEKQVERLAQSIKKFGWRGNPIIVDATNVIISGHGRRLAALKLGLTKVPVVVEDDLTAEEARAFRLADNRVAEGGIDNDLLKEELLDLGDDVGDLLDGIFESKELDFAVADIMTMNEDVFVTDLDTVMDEQAENTNEKIEAAAAKRIPIVKVLGFKDIKGEDQIYVNRFMAQLEAQGLGSGEAAFMAFIKGLVGELSHA